MSKSSGYARRVEDKFVRAANVDIRFRCISAWVDPQAVQGYHVQIKDSARGNTAVRSWVRDYETIDYVLDGKSMAKAWADEFSQQGNLRVYLRDSNPSDSYSDGYLVGVEGSGPRI